MTQPYQPSSIPPTKLTTVATLPVQSTLGLPVKGSLVGGLCQEPSVSRSKRVLSQPVQDISARMCTASTGGTLCQEPSVPGALHCLNQPVKDISASRSIASSTGRVFTQEPSVPSAVHCLGQPAQSFSVRKSTVSTGGVVCQEPSVLVTPSILSQPAQGISAKESTASPVGVIHHEPSVPGVPHVSRQLGPLHTVQVSPCDLWDRNEPSSELEAAVAAMEKPAVPSRPKQPNLTWSEKLATGIESSLPFSSSDVMPGFTAPAKPILKPAMLKASRFVLPGGKSFLDKILPSPAVKLVEHSKFDVTYFINLHLRASAPGQRGQYRWEQGTPNYLGARIPLEHTTFNLPYWRQELIGYENIEVLQFLQFGFPLGIEKSPSLSPASANHGSAYQFYPWLDKFFASGLLKGGVTGPCGSAPFSDPMVSPLMTAAKKPGDRRAVFDASYSMQSLNNSTPSDNYLGEKCLYTYPKIEDFQRLILLCGPGCMLFKRDLSRYYLQLPLDPTEYCYTGVIWRCLYFFFTALMFGLRHSGLQGQKISDATAWIHRNKGLDYLPPAKSVLPARPVPPAQPVIPAQPSVESRNTAIIPTLDPGRPKPYNLVNYSDDFAGVEKTLHKAMASFLALGSLMHALGLVESVDKACPPSTKMVFLGVHFDTEAMTMSVPADKVQELRSDLDSWSRKTTAVRRDLQSILGKMFWVSKCVRHSRPFMCRLLQQLREMKMFPESKKVLLSAESRKDLLWWSTYLRTFNGISLIFNDDDNFQTLEQLMSSPCKVYAGDATLWGGGGWYGDEYWSREFPTFLKSSAIPVHIKEFWTLIASCWAWGDSWSGQAVYLFCDNDSVCDTISYQKPRDPDLGSLLREFLYVVCLKKFSPIIRKVDTKSNFLADHISRRYDCESADRLFESVGKPGMRVIDIPDHRFKLSAPW